MIREAYPIVLGMAGKIARLKLEKFHTDVYRPVGGMEYGTVASTEGLQKKNPGKLNKYRKEMRVLMEKIAAKD